MNLLELAMANYLLNATVQFGSVLLAAMLAADVLLRRAPRLAHRVWVAALLLQVTLPLCSVQPLDLFGQLRALLADQPAAPTHVHIVFSGLGVGSDGAWHLPVRTLLIAVGAWSAVTLFLALRLGYGIWRAHRIRAAAHLLPMRSGELRMAASAAVRAPCVVGLTRPTLLVPPGFLEALTQEERAALLAHEEAHVLRHDLIWNLIYRLLALPLAFHPVTWIVRSRIASTREMICDQMAAERMGGSLAYARSLVRLATLVATAKPAMPFHAIGFAAGARPLQRRIDMLIRNAHEVRSWRAVAAGITCAILMLAGTASALIVHRQVGTQESHTTTTIAAGIAAGQVLERQQPVYPAEAKANPVDGPVILHLIIDKEGAPQNITVAQSLRPDYDRSAIDAVIHWRWRPFLINGEPTAVDTNVTITYTLAK